MRLMFAALAALWMIIPASASPHNPDDRYFDSRAPAAAPQKAMRESSGLTRKVRPKQVVQVKPRARNSVTKSVLAPRLKYHRIAWKRGVSRPPSPPHDRLTLTTADEQPKTSRETVHRTSRSHSALGPRPAKWCGWWLGQHLGMLNRALWLARNWATVGAPAAKRPGVIVVWRHHVGKVTAVRADGAIKVLSGNDGRAVRDRWRSARGVIAYRML